MRLKDLHEDIDYTPVASSWIEAVGWDGEDLYLRLLDGKEYVYYDFDEDEVDDMLQAPSHGEFFHDRIRDYYDYSRVA